MEHDGPNLSSPIFVAVLSIMSAAIVLTVYHCIVVTWCNRGAHGRAGTGDNGAASSSETSAAQLIPPAYIYGKGEGMVGGGEGAENVCAVCLSEFREGEVVRLLPECKHFFHVPCIDKWLHSHSSCPMCRAETTPPDRRQFPAALPPSLAQVPEFGG